MTAVSEALTALEEEGRREPGWHVRRVHPAAPCEVLAGLRQPDGIPGLLLEVPADQVPPDLALPRSNGFVVEPALLGGGHAGVVRFSLALTDRSYGAVFTVLCEDVAEAAAKASTPRAALRNWTGRLHIWQAFMAKHGSSGLSDAAVTGLVGELIFLREELATRVGLGAAIGMWAGPHGEPNDFALPGGFVEIKATTRQAPELVDISNAEQLDEGRGRILLGHVRLRLDGDGATLPQLAADIRRRLADEAPHRIADFDGRLLAAGYLVTHDDLYTRAYRRDRLDLFDVTGTFPRLTRSELRAGIRTCSYTIELSACAPFVVGSAVLDSIAEDSAVG
ncbi:PD-(D/E)XK motif protein [Mesorhizobium xinjiangense]|uniref:PD-(D/E)XK motif protein n=1 Tax=Mesorhizobium xinjiangense TaxID=2678685 RepID=UPI0012EDCD64|nr:PD-(D/E)XK motif protein [Mesorhizobium xinjiangense]